MKEAAVLRRGPRCQSLAGVSGGQGNYDYAAASPLAGRAPYSPRDLREETPMMKLDRCADRQERFVKTRIAVVRFSRFSSTRWRSVFLFLFVLRASRILILYQMWFEAFLTPEIESHR